MPLSAAEIDCLANALGFSPPPFPRVPSLPNFKFDNKGVFLAANWAF
jgi:hypothetical protein